MLSLGLQVAQDAYNLFAIRDSGGKLLGLDWKLNVDGSPIVWQRRMKAGPPAAKETPRYQGPTSDAITAVVATSVLVGTCVRNEHVGAADGGLCARMSDAVDEIMPLAKSYATKEWLEEGIVDPLTWGFELWQKQWFAGVTPHESLDMLDNIELAFLLPENLLGHLENPSWPPTCTRSRDAFFGAVLGALLMEDTHSGAYQRAKAIVANVDDDVLNRNPYEVGLAKAMFCNCLHLWAFQRHGSDDGVTIV